MAGVGDVLVFAFLACAGGAAVLRGLHLWRPLEGRPFDYRRVSRQLLFATLGAAFAIAAYVEFLFLTSDLSFQYVWGHSAREHILLWKVEGLWAGQEGSIFLWASSMTGALAINEWLTIRRERRPAEEGSKAAKRRVADARLGDWTAFFVLVIITSFAIVLIASNWFQLTSAEQLAGNPAGKGISSTLRTELNAIHPPIELTGYALTALPMAAAFAYLATGDKGWIRYCSFWTRTAWIFLTTGLAIGGLWAYITLGWGGYWAWDPVEVASLLPWLATTALLHAQVMHKRGKMYPLAAPLFAAIAFSLTEFGTFVTRSGVWNSVHSFIASPNVSLGDAIAHALASDLRLAVFFAMIFVPLGLLALLLRHFLKHHYKEVSFLPPRGADEDLVDYITQDKFTVFAGILMLSAILLMTFVVLVKNAAIAPQPQEYETKLAIPLFVILFFIAVNYLRRPLGSENALLAAIVASFVGAMAFILYPAPPGAGYWKLAAAAIPMVLLIFGMGAVRITGALRRKTLSSLKARARTIAILLAHVGVACVVLGYATTNVAASERPAIVAAAEGGRGAVTADVYGYTIELLNFTKDGNAGGSATEYWDKFTATYSMYDGAHHLVRMSSAFVVYKRYFAAPTSANFSVGDYSGIALIHTDVYSTLTYDLYIQINNLVNINDPSSNGTNSTVAVELSVRQIPGTWGIWLGVVLMVGGMVTLMLVEYTAQRKGGEKFTPADDPAGTPARTVPGSPASQTAPDPVSPAPMEGQTDSR